MTLEEVLIRKLAAFGINIDQTIAGVVLDCVHDALLEHEDRTRSREAVPDPIEFSDPVTIQPDPSGRKRAA